LESWKHHQYSQDIADRFTKRCTSAFPQEILEKCSKRDESLVKWLAAFRCGNNDEGGILGMWEGSQSPADLDYLLGRLGAEFVFLRDLTTSEWKPNSIGE
jgi:hypothetical protein